LEAHAVLLQFKHRGRSFQIRASVKGWAQLYLKQHPWSGRHRGTRQDYEQAAIKQGYIAASSALRDWTKAAITMIECDILSFEAVFMPFMLTSDGRPLHERASELPLLPQPEQQKVIALARP
jgi:hypothetical protein